MSARKLFYLLTILALSAARAMAQNAPIGKWQSHLPYNAVVSLATDGNYLFAACGQAFFTLNHNNEDPVTYSKVSGMGDIGMQYVGYDVLTNTTILLYANGNIDLFKNNTFYNIPDLKRKAESSTKVVYEVYAENGIAYVSTSLGIVMIDLVNHIATNTISLVRNSASIVNGTVSATSFCGFGSYYYAATNYGLYRAPKNSQHLTDPAAWALMDSSSNITTITRSGDQLYFSSVASVFKLTIADTLQVVYTSSRYIRHTDAGNTALFICEYVDTTGYGGVKMLDTAGNITDSFSFQGKPLQVAQFTSGTIWIADSMYGLRKRIGATVTDLHLPEGPANLYSYDIYANNNNVYVAHGGYNHIFLANNSRLGFSYYDGSEWHFYDGKDFPGVGSSRDFVSVLVDEKSNTLYAGSFMDGLFVLQDNYSQILGDGTIFDGSKFYDEHTHQILSMALDNKNNLWLTLMYADHQLYVKTPGNDWYKYKVPRALFGGPLAIDDGGQVYYASFSGGVGVYNTNGTLEDTTDDAAYIMTAGAGYGNLPSNNVLCVAKDNNNEIWVGSDNGICIVNSCKAPFTQQPPCDAVIPTVQWGHSAANLFAGMDVNTIAVDAANRKWVGSDDGVWLLSPDGQEVIAQYNVDNSPLPANHVMKIAIDKVTGVVYIGTWGGMVSYRGDVTAASTEGQQPLIFPNPVPAAYNGTIAIRGLAAKSDVRITDINGQLVYHHKLTSGGELVWNGKDNTGHKPQSGVYLVFISSEDGKQTATGKMVFLQ